MLKPFVHQNSHLQSRVLYFKGVSRYISSSIVNTVATNVVVVYLRRLCEQEWMVAAFLEVHHDGYKGHILRTHFSV